MLTAVSVELSEVCGTSSAQDQRHRWFSNALRSRRAVCRPPFAAFLLEVGGQWKITTF